MKTEQSVSEWYVAQLNSRISKHEADERAAKVEVPKLREDAVRVAALAAGKVIGGLPDRIVKKAKLNDYNRGAEITFTTDEVAGVRVSCDVTDGNPAFRKAVAAYRKRAQQVKEGCVECDQLRALIDTKGVNGFMAFLRSRHGRAPSLTQAKAELPQWLKLRAPAACPVL